MADSKVKSTSGLLQKRNTFHQNTSQTIPFILEIIPIRCQHVVLWWNQYYIHWKEQLPSMRMTFYLRICVMEELTDSTYIINSFWPWLECVNTASTYCQYRNIFVFLTWYSLVKGRPLKRWIYPKGSTLPVLCIDMYNTCGIVMVCVVQSLHGALYEASLERLYNLNDNM